MPSLTDPSLAPAGGETFYVLSPVPHLGSGTDWTKAAKPYRDKIMNFLEENYLPDLQENIVAEHYIDPLHFKGTLNSTLGAAFSVQPLLTSPAWFRPHPQRDIDRCISSARGPPRGASRVLSSSSSPCRLVRKDFG